MKGPILREVADDQPPVQLPPDRLGGGTPTGRDRRRSLAEIAAQEPHSRPLSPVIVIGSVRALDVLIVFATGVIARIMVGETGWSWREMLLVLAPLITVAALDAAQLYSVPAFRRAMMQIRRILVGWTATLLLLFGTVAIFSTHEARGFLEWGAAWWLLGVMTFALGRAVLRTVVRNWMRSGRLLRRTAIVGGGAAGAEVIEALASDRTSDVVLCGVFDDRQDERSPDMVAGLPKLGSVDDLVAFARRSRLDLVIFTIPISAEGRIL
jgi:FlaA1/EpsC-like NDP-sugar epimerase